MTSCINFGCTKNTYDPGKQVLDDALMELVEDIWCDGVVDVGVGEILPEWVHNWLDSGILTCMSKCCGIIIVYGVKCIKYGLQITQLRSLNVAQLIVSDVTGWTFTTFD